MALKKSIETSFGTSVEYEDILLARTANSNGKKPFEITLAGWQSKALCRGKKSNMWQKCLQTAPMAWIETNPILVEINRQVMAITKPEINNSQNDKAKQEAICQQ